MFLHARTLLLVVLMCVSSASTQHTGTDGDSFPATDHCIYPGAGPVGVEFGELRDAVEGNGVLLVDVRQPQELRDYGRIPTSVNLPLGQILDVAELSDEAFETKHGFVKPRPEDTNVVVTCTGGVRATEAWEKLQPHGYCNIRVYFGSYEDWKANNGPLE